MTLSDDPDMVTLQPDQPFFETVYTAFPLVIVGTREADGSADLVAGIATNTSAGIDLLERLTDCSALNLQDVAAKEPLSEMLTDALN